MTVRPPDEPGRAAQPELLAVPGLVGPERAAAAQRPVPAVQSSGRPLFLFDGDCGFCTASAGILRTRVRPDADIEPWQQCDLATLGVSVAEADRAVQWIGVDGTRTSGAAAIARLLRRASRPWQVAGWALTVAPVSWLAAGVYRMVANNRHRLPGSTAACTLPAAGEPTRRRAVEPGQRTDTP